MICPNGQGECRCNEFMQGWRCHPKPPPPTLAEIERLAVAYGNECGNFVGFGTGNPDSARAALMAAIRAYGRE